MKVRRGKAEFSFAGAFVFGGSVVSRKSFYEKEMETFNGRFAYEDDW